MLLNERVDLGQLCLLVKEVVDSRVTGVTRVSLRLLRRHCGLQKTADTVATIVSVRQSWQSVRADTTKLQVKNSSFAIHSTTYLGKVGPRDVTGS